MRGRRNVLTRELIRSIIEVDGPSGCWNCKHINPGKGYGQIKIGHKNWRAHRASWTAFNGDIPRGMDVLHRCDNRPCCNPDHLFLGTVLDNMQDMYAKGREKIVRGADKGTSKLTKSDVRKIVHLSKSKVTQREIAHRYGVHQSTVSDIVNGKLWNHLGLVPGSAPRYRRKHAEKRTP